MRIIELLFKIFLAIFQRGGTTKPQEVTPVPKPAPSVPVTKPVEKAPEPEIVVTGAISAKYESGGRGVRTVSTGKGDHGGVSYGKHQLASNTGTMDKFLGSQFGAPFVKYFMTGTQRLKPGTPEFTKCYLEVCNKDGEAFEKAQFDFIVSTHYAVQALKLLGSGGHKIDKRSQAVRELVYSTAVQYGPSTSLILNSGVSVDDTDEEFIQKVQRYKHDTVDLYFKSSSVDVRRSIKRRTLNEMDDLLEFARKLSKA